MADVYSNCGCANGGDTPAVRVVAGNDLTVEALVSIYDEDKGYYTAFDLSGASDVRMMIVGTYNKVDGEDVTVSGSKARALFKAGRYGAGNYGVEITFMQGAESFRVFERGLFSVVRDSGDASLGTSAEGGSGEGMNISVDVRSRTLRVGQVSGITDYNLLENKPSVNGVTLEGDKKPSDLGMYSKEEADAEFETKAHAAETFQTKESAAEADKRVQGMLDGKVDKEPGKSLSANDLTDERAGKVDMLETGGRANEHLNGAGKYSRPVRQGYGVSVAEDNTVSVDAQVIARQSDVASVAADLAAQKAKEQGDIDSANAAMAKEEADRKAAVAALQSLIDILNSDSNVDGSVKKTVADAIARVVAGAPEDFDTLKEIADYIASDKTGAAEMSAAISKLQTLVETHTKDIEANKAEMAAIPRASNIAPRASGNAYAGQGTAYSREDHVHPKPTVYDSEIKFGGPSLKATVSPIDAAMISLLGTNRAEMCNPAGVHVEYSTDGGETWIDMGISDDKKRRLLSSQQTISIELGNDVVEDMLSARIRVTLCAYNMNIYTLLKRLLINYGEVNVSESAVTMEYSTRSNQDTFVTVDTYAIGGNTAWSSIPVNNFAWGGYFDTAIYSIRLTFFVQSQTDLPARKMRILNIIPIGTTAWTTPSAFAETGHLYRWNMEGDATFPRYLSAKRFTGSGAGLTDIVKTVNGKSGDITVKETTVDAEMSDTSSNAPQNKTVKSYVDIRNLTAAEAIVSLAARLDALEGSRGLLGDATAGTLDVRELTRCRYPAVMRGHGVPAEANVPVNLPDGLPWDGVPTFVGQLYINLDAASGGLYYAAGNEKVSDWKQA